MTQRSVSAPALPRNPPESGKVRTACSSSGLPAFLGSAVSFRRVCAGQEVKFKHQDFEYKLEGNIYATFLWRAFAPNVTALYKEW